jgi:7-cyano-7-deazaguanine synthase
MVESSSEKPSALVLLSSGLDSTYNLYKARQRFHVKLALTFDYGQRASAREILAANKIAKRVGVPHKVVHLPWFKDFTTTTLLAGPGDNVPLGSEVKIDSLERSMETARRVWVPNRNGIFLNIAAGYAEGLGCQYVVPGFNYEEAQTFPDNSHGFLKALDESFAYSTDGRVRPICFSIDMHKEDIVRGAVELGVPLNEIWPCYQGGAKWCGECESCLRFKRALGAMGLSFDELQAGIT